MLYWSLRCGSGKCSARGVSVCESASECVLERSWLFWGCCAKLVFCFFVCFCRRRLGPSGGLPENVRKLKENVRALPENVSGGGLPETVRALPENVRQNTLQTPIARRVAYVVCIYIYIYVYIYIYHINHPPGDRSLKCNLSYVFR